MATYPTPQGGYAPGGVAYGGRRYYTYGPKSNVGVGPNVVGKPGKGQQVRYTKGKGFWLGPKVVAAAAKAAAGGAGNAGATKGLTLVQQQLKEAAAIAAAGLDPQIKTTERAREAERLGNLAEQQQAADVMKAFGELTAGDAEASRAAYAAAAERIGSYGAAFTGELRGSLEEAAAQASATIANQAPVVSKAGPIADTVMLTEAAMPGADLATQSAAQQGHIAALRGISAKGLLEQANIEKYKGGLDVAKINDAVRELEAKRPGLITEALSDIKQAYNAKRATDTQIGYLQLQQAKTIWDRAEAMTNMLGTLHVVKNGKIVNTGKVAGGSEAVQTQVAATTSITNANTRAATAAAALKAQDEREAMKEKGRNDRAAAAIKAAADLAAKRQNNPNAAITPTAKASIIEGAHATGTSALKDYMLSVWGRIPDAGDFDTQRDDEDVKAWQARQKRVLAAYANRLKLNRGTAMAKVINTLGPLLKIPGVGYNTAMIKALAGRIVSSESAFARPPTTRPSPMSGR